MTSAAALLWLRATVLDEQPVATRAAAAFAEVLPESAAPSAPELVERLRSRPAARTGGVLAEPLQAAHRLLDTSGAGPGRDAGQFGSGREALAGALWRGELGWWRAAEQTGVELLRTSSFDRQLILGTVLVLAADAWRTQAALGAVAAGDGGPEVFRALA